MLYFYTYKINPITLITYKYDSIADLLAVKFSGTITVHEIVDYFNQIMIDELLPKSLNILINAQEIVLDFDDQELLSIANANEGMFSKYENMTVAFVVNSPTETALSVMYKKLTESRIMKFQVFCTIEAAENWLNSVI